MSHEIMMTDAVTGARMRIRPELIIAVDAGWLEVPSGERLCVALVRLTPGRLFGQVDSERGVTLVVDEPATWIRDALESIERTRAKSRKRTLSPAFRFRTPRELLEATGAELAAEGMEAAKAKSE